MYNQYIPQNTSYDWVGPVHTQPGREQNHPQNPGSSSLLGRLWELLGLSGRQSGEKTGGILKLLHLDELDSGDILVLLIAALLWKEGKEIDLPVALVLVFLFGAGNDGKKENT